MKRVSYIICASTLIAVNLQAQTAKQHIDANRAYADSVFFFDNDTAIAKNLFVLDTFKCIVQDNQSTFTYNQNNIVDDLRVLTYYYKFNFGNFESPSFVIQIRPTQPEINNPYPVPHLNLKTYKRFVSNERIAEIAKKELYANPDQVIIRCEYNTHSPDGRFEITDDFVIEIRKRHYSYTSLYVNCIKVNPFTGEIIEKKWKKVNRSKVKF